MLVPTIANTEDVMARFVPIDCGTNPRTARERAVAATQQPAPASRCLRVPILGSAMAPSRWRPSVCTRTDSTDLHIVDAAGPAAYRYLGLEPFSAGSTADLVLFADDPAADPSVLLSPVAGMRAGRIIFDRGGLFPPSEDGVGGRGFRCPDVGAAHHPAPRPSDGVRHTGRGTDDAPTGRNLRRRRWESPRGSDRGDLGSRNHRRLRKRTVLPLATGNKGRNGGFSCPGPCRC